MAWVLAISSVGNLGLWLLWLAALDSRDFYKRRAESMEASVHHWRNKFAGRPSFKKEA